MIQPTQIVEESDREVSITWSDDSRTVFTASQLRRACPCAACVNEWTGEKILDPGQIADDLKISSLSIVGRYALNFVFSDGHDSGIFSFGYLREMS